LWSRQAALIYSYPISTTTGSYHSIIITKGEALEHMLIKRIFADGGETDLISATRKWSITIRTPNKRTRNALY